MPEYNISSGLPSYPAGLSDKETAIVLPLYRAINSLAQRLSEVTGDIKYSQSELSGLNALRELTDEKYTLITVKATTALLYGRILNVQASGSYLAATHANNVAPILSGHAICVEPAGIALGTFGKAIWMHGRCAGVSGTGFGNQYWLGAAGIVQLAKPTTAGQLAQVVGFGLGSAGFYLNISTAGTIV